MNYKVIDDTESHIYFRFIDTHTFLPPLRGYHMEHSGTHWIFRGLHFCSVASPVFELWLYPDADRICFLPGLYPASDDTNVRVPIGIWPLWRPALDQCMFAVNNPWPNLLQGG